jgi:hypothetical protein
MAEASRIIGLLAMSAGRQASFKPVVYLARGCLEASSAALRQTFATPP